MVANRMRVHNDWGEFLVDGCATDLLDEQDVKEFERNVAAVRARESESAADNFRTEFAATRRSAAISSRASSRSKASRKFVTSSGQKIRGEWTGCDMEIAPASLMCPSPCRLYKDQVNGRWQIYYPGVGSRSRSFHLHGPAEGLRQLLVWGRTEVLMRAGLELTECPIVGLFERRAADGGSHASSSTAR